MNLTISINLKVAGSPTEAFGDDGIKCFSSVIFVCDVVSEKILTKNSLLLHLLHKAIQIKNTLDQTEITRLKITRHFRMLVSGIQ